MFLLPSVAIGVLLAVLLGGRPSRLLEIRFRHQWAVFAALGMQVAIFSSLPTGALQTPVHLASYALLFLFAAANVANLALLPLSLGMAANATAIVANGGHMPVSPNAWEAAGLGDVAETNVRVGGENLAFLGDNFALPPGFPLANVFSVGDILIGLGMAGMIVALATAEGGDRRFAASRLLHPLRVPYFRRVASAKLLSHIGDWVTVAALVGWVYEETRSTAHVAAVLLVRLAPPIVGGGVAAAVADRLPRERLLVWVELGRCVAVSAAFAGVVIDESAVAYAAVAASGILATVSGATLRSMVPALLDETRLPAGNAVMNIADDVAMAIGALVAGVALAASDASVALALDLIAFAAAAALYWGAHVALEPTERPRDPGSVRAGLRYVFSHPLLLVIIGAFSAATVATGLMNATLPRFLDSELGLGPAAYGFGLAALAGGLAAGEAVVGLARVGDTGGRWIGAALLVMAATFVTLAYTEHAPTALLLLAFIGFLDGTTDVLFDTIVQREADPSYYGRVFGLGSVFFTTTMIAAVLAAPLANGFAAPKTVIVVAATALVVGSVIALAGTRVRATPRAARIAPEAT